MYVHTKICSNIHFYQPDGSSADYESDVCEPIIYLNFMWVGVCPPYPEVEVGRSSRLKSAQRSVVIFSPGPIDSLGEELSNISRRSFSSMIDHNSRPIKRQTDLPYRIPDLWN